MKKKIFIPLAAIILIAVVVSILKSGDKAEAKVETQKVRQKDLMAIVNCSGTIQPKRKVDVSANAMGTIVHLAVVEGQHVAQGDLLMEIDPFEYDSAVKALEAAISSSRADLKLAEASLDKAIQDRDRAEELFKEELASEEQVATARTNARIEEARVEAASHRITQYEANLAKANHDLTKVTITAPMTGVITRLNVEEGENAIMGTLNNPGTVLLVIADLGTMEAWVEVDETEVVKVTIGQVAEVKIDAFPDQEFTGKVTEIGNSPLRVRTGSSREAVDFEVKITLDGTLPNIRPGLSAKAEITVADRQEALAVPLGSVTVREWPLEDSDIRSYTGKRDRKQKEALAEFDFGVKDSGRDTTDSSAADVKREETEGVFVLVDDFVKFVPVEIGIAGEEDFEVLSGLTEGQTVVTGPFRILRQLKDGAQVEQLGLKGKRGRRGSGDETED
ncbi:MAG: efflux RND transporter periplasmic adaptor subunit [Candidatus Krumholzibacteria bacterium]|nr:efflux RND transporter periplasmic adaptor subunit [Candidatus Krumholzibacteria bacterium]